MVLRLLLTYWGRKVCILNVVMLLKTKITQQDSVPRLASTVTLARGPRPWRRFTHGPFNNTANFPLRDYATQKIW